MQRVLTETVVHLSQSHQQLARILEAKRQITVRMAELVNGLPDHQPELNGMEGLLDSSSQVTKSIVAYLNGLAELVEATGDSLSHVVKASRTGEDEE
ncbi:nucleoside-diphosphate sugar epimerase [Cohnella caldifontis]|uniref:nucleoside-diphosphate sugar epimerase n=1 Tax=Cohnella caldifontis TaxID=3027471 RepID=UPI0023EDDCDC|nr:nucleoside-diphosphate sugar epimerase [Cohnella sp. YIM B05605]